jgi:hypothetical protein
MQKCRQCEEVKEDDAFAYRDKKRGKRQTLCRECKTSYNKEWYRQNSDTHKLAVAATSIVIRERNKQWLQNLKKDLQCLKCGESDPACLDLHHRNPAGKDMSLGSAISRGWSLAGLQSELEKCDVLCANCHRKHHYKERLAHGQRAGRYLTCIECELTWSAAVGPRCSYCARPGIAEALLGNEMARSTIG